MKQAAGFLILFCALGCSSPNKDNICFQALNGKVFTDSLSLEKKGQKVFQLDSGTAMTSYSVHFFNSNDSLHFYSMLNAREDYINVYNYNSGDILKKIALGIEGPNGVGSGNGLMAHHFISPDSILVYNYHLFTLFLINDSSKILAKYKLQGRYDKKQDMAVPEPSTLKPMVVTDNKVYLIGSLVKAVIKDKSNSGMIIAIDLKSGEINRSLERPDIYNTGNWSAHYLKTALYGDFNTDLNNYVYSFGADPFVYETNHSGLLKKHFMGSKYLKKVSPLSFSSNDSYDSRQVKRYDFTSGAYSKIIYDKYNKFYFRFVFLPLLEHEYKETEGIYDGKESVIIFDNRFVKLGEFLLPRHTYDFSNFFINEEGLHLKLLPSLEPDEDKMTYDIFRLKTVD